MNGLTEEMREVVNMCKPTDLPDMIATAYQMEDSSLYSLVQKEVQLRRSKEGGSVNQAKKSYSSFTPTAGWRQKQTVQTGDTSQTKQVPTVKQPLKLTEAQIVEKRRLGLCFKCDAKWSRQHLVNGVCPNASLRVLTVVNGMTVELIEQEESEMEDDIIV